MDRAESRSAATPGAREKSRRLASAVSRKITCKLLKKLSIKRNTGAFGNGSQLLDDRQNEGHTVVAPNAFRFAFGVTRKQRAGRTWGRFRSAKHANVIIHLRLKDIGVDEAIDSHSAEEVSDPFPDTARWKSLGHSERWGERAPIRTAERATQKIYHDGQAVAFVTTAFAVGTQRQQRSAGHDVRGVRSAVASIVHCPAFRNFLSLSQSHFDFSIRSRTCSHINHNGWLVLARECDCNGIRTEHALHAPQRGNDGRCIGHCPPDHVVGDRLEYVVAGDAEMIGVHDGNPTGSRFLCQVDGHLIRARAYHQTEAVIAINGRGTWRRSQKFDLRFGINQALANLANVAAHTRHAVRVDTSQVCGNEHISGLRSVAFRQTKIDEHASAELVQRFRRKRLGSYTVHGVMPQLIRTNFPPVCRVLNAIVYPPFGTSNSAEVFYARNLD